jgi:hypothetical protein
MPAAAQHRHHLVVGASAGGVEALWTNQHIRGAAASCASATVTSRSTRTQLRRDGGPNAEDARFDRGRGRDPEWRRHSSDSPALRLAAVRSIASRARLSCAGPPAPAQSRDLPRSRSRCHCEPSACREVRGRGGAFDRCRRRRPSPGPGGTPTRLRRHPKGARVLAQVAARGREKTAGAERSPDLCEDGKARGRLCPGVDFLLVPVSALPCAFLTGHSSSFRGGSFASSSTTGKGSAVERVRFLWVSKES